MKNYKKLAAAFKGGSAIRLYMAAYLESDTNGFPEGKKISSAQHMAFSFGMAVGLVAEKIYPGREDYGYIEHELAWQDNAKSPHIWEKSLVRPKLLEGLLQLSEADQNRFAALCAENPKGEIDGPAFLGGLFSASSSYSYEVIKKDFGLTNADIAKAFGLNEMSFKNSSALPRYKEAVEKLYSVFLNGR